MNIKLSNGNAIENVPIELIREFLALSASAPTTGANENPVTTAARKVLESDYVSGPNSRLLAKYTGLSMRTIQRDKQMGYLKGNVTQSIIDWLIERHQRVGGLTLEAKTFLAYLQEKQMMKTKVWRSRMTKKALYSRINRYLGRYGLFLRKKRDRQYDAFRNHFFYRIDLEKLGRSIGVLKQDESLDRSVPE